MERKISKYRQMSPDRAKVVWKERSPKYVQVRKVHVVYYLCRNHQLEHPHFIEVPMSSPHGLYLRDVIARLNSLRGRGMASMYSWSSKRSYKNGFVWHDLCEDDLIHPAHRDEYILKGSEIIEESNTGRFSPVAVYRMHNLKQFPEPPSCRNQVDTSPSMSMDGKETRHPREEEISPTSERSGSSAVSPESRAGSHSPWNASLSLTEYKVPSSEGATDASTQTEENAGQTKHKETCTRGVSTEDETLNGEYRKKTQTDANSTEQSSEVHGVSISPPPPSSASSSVDKAETLESLIRSDLSKINSFRSIDDEDMRMPNSIKIKASNVLMQLISCGSISVKDHSFGLIPIYRPRLSDSKFPSPLYSTSVMLGELDCLPDNSRLNGLRSEDKEYFSGSLVEAKVLKEQEDGCTLKRSSSYNADRSAKKPDSVINEESPATKIKCIPRTIKNSLSKPRSEFLRSPISDKPRVSSDRAKESRITSHDASNVSSKSISEPSSGKNPSTRVNSFREEDKIIKIEERLSSGARVIIQSKECQS